MNALFPLSHNRVTFLTLILLLISLTACGSSTGTAPSIAFGKSATGGAASGMTANNSFKGLSIDADGLHIEYINRIECEPGNSALRIPPDHLVLATGQLTYDSGEIQQMTAYFNALFQTDMTAQSIQHLSTPLPASLRWVQGGTYMGSSTSDTPGCAANLEITNTGNGTIQIASAGIRLTEAPQVNTFQYRLIDACSFISHQSCACHECGAGPSICSPYYAAIHLGYNQKNALLTVKPNAGPSCGEMTLQPGQTNQLLITFYSAPPPSHLRYSVVPELTLDTPSGQHILQLPLLGNRITFATPGQFSCYGLQGHTFVAVQKQAYPNSNCI